MNETKTKEISFGVQGEFVTKIAREWFYTGEKSFDEVMEFLLACMENPDISENERKRHAADILLGWAALKGSSAAGTYHLERYEPGEEEPMPKIMNIWKEVEKRKEAEKKLSKMVEKWDIAMKYISEDTKLKIRKALGEETAEDRQQETLSNYVRHMADKKEHTTADYGWLEPDGTFHSVKWGDHEKWAELYLQKTMSRDECYDTLFAGDYLVNKGWVLLHNPSMGIASPTKDDTKRYTQAQKNFLYDYYIERDCHEEANAIWQEDE